MRQDVAGSGNPGPGNLGSLTRESLGTEVSDDLSDDFEVADYCVLGFPVANELLAPLGSVFAYALQSVGEMSQEDLAVFHSGRASARTRSRK